MEMLWPIKKSDHSDGNSLIIFVVEVFMGHCFGGLYHQPTTIYYKITILLFVPTNRLVVAKG
jgi:hypothetical protein